MALTQLNKNGKPLQVLLVMAITSRKGRGGGGGRDSPGDTGTNNKYMYHKQRLINRLSERRSCDLSEKPNPADIPGILHEEIKSYRDRDMKQ